MPLTTEDQEEPEKAGGTTHKEHGTHEGDASQCEQSNQQLQRCSALGTARDEGGRQHSGAGCPTKGVARSSTVTGEVEELREFHEGLLKTSSSREAEREQQIGPPGGGRNNE